MFPKSNYVDTGVFRVALRGAGQLNYLDTTIVRPATNQPQQQQNFESATAATNTTTAPTTAPSRWTKEYSSPSRRAK